MRRFPHSREFHLVASSPTSLTPIPVHWPVGGRKISRFIINSIWFYINFPQDTSRYISTALTSLINFLTGVIISLRIFFLMTNQSDNLRKYRAKFWFFAHKYFVIDTLTAENTSKPGLPRSPFCPLSPGRPCDLKIDRSIHYTNRIGYNKAGVRYKYDTSLSIFVLLTGSPFGPSNPMGPWNHSGSVSIPRRDEDKR